MAAFDKIPTQCSNCHSGIEEIESPIFGLTFPHKNHLFEQKIECSACHSNVRTHGEFIATKRSCAVCHHKDTEKDCTGCHELQKTFYQGGKLNGHDIPMDIMSEAEVQCTDCHIGPRDQIFRSDKNKCFDCHDDEYGDLFVEWQDTVKSLIQSLRKLSQEKKKLDLKQDQRRQILEIEQFIKRIQFDGSSGIHNLVFIEDMLTSFRKTLESVGKTQE